jgi:ADP-ribosylglycohydrolase
LTLSSDNGARLARAYESLEGLSIGDAFGERFFDEEDIVVDAIDQRQLPATPWRFTDDTQMALSIVQTLRRHGSVEQAALARSFADQYDNSRGYGPAMHSLLQEVQRSPASWERLAKGQFHGQGSYGNGSAMRVAPLGAYFADDMNAVVEQARLSSMVTHTHDEGVAGAVAVAAAAAIACNLRGGPAPTRAEFLEMVIGYVPDSLVYEMLRRAQGFGPDTDGSVAAAILGTGVGISAPDTVPYALWCVGEQLASYEETLWLTVSGLGDRDTTCAIAGGVVTGYVGADSIPAVWRTSREPLPGWYED